MHHCKHPGCFALLAEPGYCDRHKPYDVHRPKPYAKAVRYNTELYNTAQWRALRRAVMDRDGHKCVRCGCQSGLSVHHVRPPKGDVGLFYDAGNCVTLCADCHAVITGREQAR